VPSLLDASTTTSNSAVPVSALIPPAPPVLQPFTLLATRSGEGTAIQPSQEVPTL
jgi:hypothetical protein